MRLLVRARISGTLGEKRSKLTRDSPRLQKRSKLKKKKRKEEARKYKSPPSTKKSY